MNVCLGIAEPPKHVSAGAARSPKRPLRALSGQAHQNIPSKAQEQVICRPSKGPTKFSAPSPEGHGLLLNVSCKLLGCKLSGLWPTALRRSSGQRKLVRRTSEKQSSKQTNAVTHAKREQETTSHNILPELAQWPPRLLLSRLGQAAFC